MITLGLDVSTSITGVAVVEDGSLVYYSSVNTKNKNKFASINDVVDAIEEELKKVKTMFTVDNIYIEESLKSFANQASSANTLIVLSKINALVTYISYKIFNIEPIHKMARSMRTKLNIDTKGKNAKHAVLDHVQLLYPIFTPELNRAGNIKEDYYDMADAIVVATYGNMDSTIGKGKNT